MRRVALTAIAAFCAAMPLAAQSVSERTDLHLRNDCRLATQNLATGEPGPLHNWALGVIGQCEVSGGTALAAIWSSPPSDSADLEQLYAASAHIRDRQIFDAARGVSLNTAAPTLTRLAALRVLAAYVNHRILTNFDFLSAPVEPGVRLRGYRDHSAPIEGRSPLNAGTEEEIRGLLRTLAANDPDARVRYAASYLLDVLG